MKTLIIPASGRSSRFKGLRPKWLLTHPNGNLMIEEVVNGMEKSHSFERIIVTIVRQHCIDFEADIILEQALGKKIEICILDDFTSSQSHTVYLTLKKMDVKGSFVIRDSDNQVSVEKLHNNSNFVVGLDIHNQEVSNLPGKSFILKKDDDIIENIIEKRMVSDIISLGVYGFRSSDKFIEVYEILDKLQEYDNREIYVSHVISYMLLHQNAIFKFIESFYFEDWGTLQDWIRVQEKNATYFIDIDGVVIKNSGKYGRINWNNNEVFLEANINVVNELYNEGAKIIFVTSRPESQRENVLKLFEKARLKYHTILFDCKHAPRIIINDFAPSNPYPSCSAVNIPRNGNIQDYVFRKKVY